MSVTFRSFAKRAYLKLLNITLFVSALFYRGETLACPVCGWKFRKMRPYRGQFFIKGELVDHYTPNALCPRCTSDIRHRFVLSYLKRKSGVMASRMKMLHFAPEVYLSSWLNRQKNIEYIKCDIEPERFPGAIKVDITDIKFDDKFFDAIVCIHVLEHIKDDKKAIDEIYRILKPGGWALIAIPVYGDSTIEIMGLLYEGREKMYGTGEHMRMNGLDFTEKLSGAGFSVEVVSFDDVPGDYIDRTVVSPHTVSDRYLFFCRK